MNYTVHLFHCPAASILMRESQTVSIGTTCFEPFHTECMYQAIGGIVLARTWVACQCMKPDKDWFEENPLHFTCKNSSPQGTLTLHLQTSQLTSPGHNANHFKWSLGIHGFPRNSFSQKSVLAVCMKEWYSILFSTAPSQNKNFMECPTKSCQLPTTLQEQLLSSDSSKPTSMSNSKRTLASQGFKQYLVSANRNEYLTWVPRIRTALDLANPKKGMARTSSRLGSRHH